MVRSPDHLEAQLLSLPPGDRARLAEVLLASLEPSAGPASVAEVETAWQVEGERRLADLRAGRVAGIPAEQVFAAVQGRLAR